MSRQRVLPSQQQQQQQQASQIPPFEDYRPVAAPYRAAPHGQDARPRTPSRDQGSERPPNGYERRPSRSHQHADFDNRSQASASGSSRQRPPRLLPENGGPPGSGPSSRRGSKDELFDVDEATILKTYGLSTLQPNVWEDAGTGRDGLFSPGLPSGPLAPHEKDPRQGGMDEPDPLGLYRGGILSTVGDIPPETRSSILLQSKTFDPKTFLNTVHPGALPQDLARGQDNLQKTIDSRSGALQRLVEDNFDRFISIKAATGLVYEELKMGAFSDTGDYSVGDLRESLSAAQQKADDVWNPILEARSRADRLRSTLGVFNRSKFFFTLPGLLNESIAAGRYDAAMQAYKKGKYLLDSRPGALLGLPPGTTMTDVQREKHRRVFEKVWGQVENTMSDLKQSLTQRLRDPRRPLEEVEKTIEILLELDPASEPVWTYFDTQHFHIQQALKNSYNVSLTKFQSARRRVTPNTTDEVSRATDIRACVLAAETPSFDHVAEKAAGAEVWKALSEVVHNMCDIIMQTMPNFWKIARAYMDGKYQSKTDVKGKSKHGQDGSRRSPSQVRVMSNDIVNLFIGLISEFLVLSSSTQSPRPGAGAEDVPLPQFVPENSNALGAGWHSLRIIGELSECTNELGALQGLGSEAINSLKEFITSVRWKFTEGICIVWVRDAKIFYRLEDWQLDNENQSKTVYLKRVRLYQRTIARLAYRAGGGDEERSNNLFVTNQSAALGLLRRGNQDSLASDFAKRIHTAYLDASYAFLDGLVHVAFSDPMPLEPIKAASPVMRSRSMSRSNTDATAKLKKPAEELDISDREVRIILTVSNLTHFKEEFVKEISDQLQTALKIDMSKDSNTLNEVVSQLDKILFDDYIKSRSTQLGKMIEAGVLGQGVDWSNAPKPTEVHPYIYEVLLSLVLVHAQVTAIARSLVTRTVGALVEECAKHALNCFKQIQRFGMGGMLQATLEMEFLHQTLNVHVSPSADASMQEIYRVISAAYTPPSGVDSHSELQNELEQLKQTLTQARRATALQFLCFREKRPSIS